MKNIFNRVKKIVFLNALFFACLFAIHKTYGQENSATNRKFPGDYLAIGSSKIYYEEAGNGEPIILVHDGLVNSMTWDGVWGALAKTYHVVRYDRRGYGLSDTPTTAFSQIDDLYKLM